VHIRPSELDFQAADEERYSLFYGREGASPVTLFETIEEQRTLRPLRGRQIALDKAIYDAVRAGHKRIVVQLPTGGGKTVIAAHLMDRSAKKGRRPMFVAPAIALVEQTLKSFEDQGIGDIGIIQAQHYRTDFRAQVQIASRDTLIRRDLPEVDFVIVDEVHDQRDALNLILDGAEWKNKIVIGLSATPWSRGLGLHWSKLIIGATIADMIEDGAPTGLCDFVVYAPSDAMEPSDKGMKVVAGEFQEAAVYKAMSEPAIVGDVVDNWMRRRQAEEHCGDRTFLYGVNRAHAKSLMEAFKAQGVACGYIDGESPAEERKRTFARYRSREDKVLANVGVLVTGVDEDVRSIIDATMRKSEINWVQAFGRGLRLADGKDYLRFYDHGGNSYRLGLPTNIHHEELDCRKPGEKEDADKEDKPAPKPHKCPQCRTMIPPASKKCPTCGYVRPIVNHIEHVQGELIELTSKTKVAKKQGKPKKDEKQAFYSGLLSIAQERGYKPGWVANHYRANFGVWPRGLVDFPVRPTPTVRKFIHDKQLAYFNSKKKEVTND
jgi:DNA repair protein RadD